MSQEVMGRSASGHLGGCAPYSGTAGAHATANPVPPSPTEAMGQLLQDQARALECLMALEGKLYAQPGPPLPPRASIQAPSAGPISVQLLIEAAVLQARELMNRAQILLERI